MPRIRYRNERSLNLSLVVREIESPIHSEFLQSLETKVSKQKQQNSTVECVLQEIDFVTRQVNSNNALSVAMICTDYFTQYNNNGSSEIKEAYRRYINRTTIAYLQFNESTTSSKAINAMLNTLYIYHAGANKPTKKSSSLWKSLSPSQRDHIKDQIITYILNSNNIPQIIICLRHLVRFQFDFKSDANPSFRQSLMNILTLSKLNDKNSLRKSCGEFIYCLALLNVQWSTDIPSEGKVSWSQDFQRYSYQMKLNELCDVIYALGKMKVPFRTLSCKKNILVGLEKIFPDIPLPSVHHTIWSMGNMGMAWEYLPFTLKHQILNKLNINDPMKTTPGRSNPLVSHPTPHQSFSLKAISNIFIGLSKMSCQLPSSLQNSLIYNLFDAILLSSTLPSHDRTTHLHTIEQTLSNIIWSLGNINTHFYQFPVEIQQNFWKYYEMILPIITNQGFSNSLQGFAKMNVKYNMLPHKIQELLDQNFEAMLKNSADTSNVSNYLNVQSFSNVVWSLGTMEATGISHNSIINLLSTTKELVHLMNGPCLIMVLTGLKKMNCPLQNCPLDLQSNFLTCIRKNFQIYRKLLQSQPLPRPSAQSSQHFVGKETDIETNFYTLLYSISFFEIPWIPLHPVSDSNELECLLHEVYQSIVEIVKACTPTRSSSMVTQSVEMEGESKEGNPSVRMKKEKVSLGAKAIASILYSILMIRNPSDKSDTLDSPVVDDVPSVLMQPLEVAIIQLSERLDRFDSSSRSSSSEIPSQDISNILYNLSKLGLKRAQMSPSLQSALIKLVEVSVFFMTEQQLGIGVYASMISSMGFRFQTHLPTSLQQDILLMTERLGYKLKWQSLVGILQGLGREEGVIHWLTLPSSFQHVILTRIIEILTNQAAVGINLSVDQLKFPSLVLLGLGRLSAPWVVEDDEESSELLGTLQQMLFHSIFHEKDRQVDVREGSLSREILCTALSGIARMIACTLKTSGEFKKSNWKSILNDHDRNGLMNLVMMELPRLSGSHLATVAWSLAIMKVTAIDLTTTEGMEAKLDQRSLFLDQYRQKLSEMNEKEFIWSIWALSIIGFTFNEFEKELQFELLQRTEKILFFFESFDQYSNEEIVEKKKTFGLLMWVLGCIQSPLNDFPTSLKIIIFQNIDIIATEKQSRFSRRKNNFCVENFNLQLQKQ